MLSMKLKSNKWKIIIYPQIYKQVELVNENIIEGIRIYNYEGAYKGAFDTTIKGKLIYISKNMNLYNLDRK